MKPTPERVNRTLQKRPGDRTGWAARQVNFKAEAAPSLVQVVSSPVFLYWLEGMNGGTYYVATPRLLRLQGALFSFILLSGRHENPGPVDCQQGLITRLSRMPASASQLAGQLANFHKPVHLVLHIELVTFVCTAARGRVMYLTSFSERPPHLGMLSRVSSDSYSSSLRSLCVGEQIYPNDDASVWDSDFRTIGTVYRRMGF